MSNKNNLWKPGQSGNPKGRPKGSRNKLSEDFLKDLRTLWNEAQESGETLGQETLRRVFDKAPEKVMQALVQVLPKDFQLSVENDGAKWVISSDPYALEKPSSEWAKEHGILIEGSKVEQ